MTQAISTLSVLAHPYTHLQPITKGPPEMREASRQAGTALVWFMAAGRYQTAVETVADRPGGMSLLVILPPGLQVALDRDVRMAVEYSRPHGILPFHADPDPNDLTNALRRPPSDLGSEVTDYLSWRGLGVDRDTAHIIRRIVDLSSELRSVSAMSRSLYLSRRALGRRFMSRGLPVPSHWLQMARLLRVAARLQNSESTVASIAIDHGYPDGFSVSNQMERLLGHRPSEIRERLGWEWILEAWLRREAELGTLAPISTRGARSERDRPSRRRTRSPEASTSTR
ncbi:MAG: helix-turn-helix domain-containing protein [Gemmatimonadales bacterium]